MACCGRRLRYDCMQKWRTALNKQIYRKDEWRKDPSILMTACECGCSRKDLPFYSDREYLEKLFDISITESRRERFLKAEDTANEYLGPYTNITNVAYPTKDSLPFQAYQP